MKINIPKVTKPIRLSDYAPEFGEQSIQMWVNPPREKRLAFAEIADRFGAARDSLEAAVGEEDKEASEQAVKEIEALVLEIYGWYAEMWSQGGDEWTAEDIKDLATAASDTDPQLWGWLQDRALDLMGEYRRQKKVG